ncbi:hypothetical protein, partial [Marinitenerispora sediminis]
MLQSAYFIRDIINGVVSGVSGVVGDAAETAFEGILNFFSDAVIEAIGSVVETLGTMWVDVDTPDLVTGRGSSIAQGAEPEGAGYALDLMQYTVWISLGVCVFSLIALGGMLALARHRGDGGGMLRKVGFVLFGVVLISAASAIVSGLLASVGGTGAGGPAAYLQNSLWWYMGAAAVVSVIIGGAKMAWEQRAEPGKELVKSLFTLVVVSGAGLTFISLAVEASDAFSEWILEGAMGGRDFAENMTVLLVVGTASGAVSLVLPLIIIVLGLVALCFSLMQMMLMVVRIGMLVVLAGVLPLTASFTNTEIGRSWFRKCVGWLVAFILYKPAAAIVYAAAFQLANSNIFDDEQGLIKFLAGVTLMGVALIAMPALMRFAVPMVGGMAGGAAVGGAMAGGAMDAATSLPTGAKPTG